MSRGGRPRSAQTRTAQVQVRLTPAELTAICERAGGRGKVAAYLRSLGLGRRPRGQVPAINREAWIELAATAANLNQLAHHANAGRGMLPTALEQTIATMFEQVAALRLALLGVSEDDAP